ncbi:hypothetical protein ASE00_18040 [Sphingomonas sp. Root710]|uniref:hypothetical protein n=1 Tax=Sphingomonas sp. Root710 TaxID=1736594 RepID=UPI00070176A8|nr:hypothetical protein [Sphingomonas sp. Root710]KRB80910.1 hypothetical protein ASE00_18040 [Sphingomonas sp. Root710]
MARALKVFRTSTGFHDAYVAAPSRAAALRAWGSDQDLFARGAAEQIDDPRLMAEPLAHPGVVIRTSRGSLEDQLAALPEDRPRPKPAASIAEAPSAAPSPRPGTRPKKPRPRPSRARLDRAEAAIDRLVGDQRAALAELADREAALRRERHDLEARHHRARAKAEAAAGKARAAYDAALERWRAGD